MYTVADKCPICPNFSDMYWDHAIFCGTEGEHNAHHKNLTDIIYHTFTNAAIDPTKEGRPILLGSNAMHADVFFAHLSSGKDTAWEMTGEPSAAGVCGHTCHQCWVYLENAKGLPWYASLIFLTEATSLGLAH